MKKMMNVKSMAAMFAAIISMGSFSVAAFADEAFCTPELGSKSAAECVTVADNAPEINTDTVVEISAFAVVSDEAEIGEGFKGQVAAIEDVKGDVNGDGVVNVADLSAVTAHINGFKALGAADAADVNNDGAVNVADAGIISASIKGVRALG